VIVPGYEDLDATLSAAVLDALRLAHGRGARLVSLAPDMVETVLSPIWAEAGWQ